MEATRRQWIGAYGEAMKKRLTFGEVLADATASDMYITAEDADHLEWTIAELKKEVTRVTPDWARVMRLFDQAEWPSPSSAGAPPK